MNITSSSPLHKEKSINRVIYQHFNSVNSPTIVVFAGIHGNEPAGVYALHNVIKKIKNNAIALTGNFYAFTGNLNALKKNIRFQDEDLNRVWTRENIQNLTLEHVQKNAEQHEQAALLKIIKNILKKHSQDVTFIDLHTTSSETIPFITISDSLNNRTYTSNFNLPIILGIEEYLEGPLLTYINEFGYTSLGFEAGQHQSKKSIVNSEAFIWVALAKSKMIATNAINIKQYEKILNNAVNVHGFFEINYIYRIQKNETFKMIKGFQNFEKINLNKPLAIVNNKLVKATKEGLIFMPLYQKQGKEGFFIINRVSSFWLYLSIYARKLNLQHVLRILPGIKQNKQNKYILEVNTNTAKFLATEIFHLFGYRKKIAKKGKLFFIRRDRKIIDFH